MARITLDNIDSIRSDEYDASVVRFVAKNWEAVSDRVAKRTITWLRSQAVDMTPALQVVLLELDEKALRYISDLSRAGQRFVLDNLEESDLSAMIGKAHGYSVIVPELWEAIISQLEAGTLNKRELAAYEQRDRLPRAFKQALASRNIASVTELSDAIGHAARSRRANKIDYLKAFEEATTVVQIRNAAELLLKACKDGQVESTSAARRAIRNVISAASARDVKVAQKEAWAKFQPEDKPVKPMRQARTPKVVVEPESDLLDTFKASKRSINMQDNAQALMSGARRAGIKLDVEQRRALKAVIEAEGSKATHAAFKAAVASLEDDGAASDAQDDLLTTFLSSTRSAAMQENAEALLRGARRAGIKITAAQRRALKAVGDVQSSAYIRAAFKEAVAELSPNVSVGVKPEKAANRFADVDVAPRRPKTVAESDEGQIPEVDLVAAWLNARRTEDMKETSAQLLKGARRASITLNKEVRECLKDVQAAESRTDIRAAYHDAVNAYQNGDAEKRSAKMKGSETPSAKAARTDEAAYGRLARTLILGAEKSAASDDSGQYEIPDDDDDQDRSSRRRRSSATAHHKSEGTSRRRAVSDSDHVSRRRVGADRSKDTDFSDAARVTASVRRVRRPQDHV